MKIFGYEITNLSRKQPERSRIMDKSTEMQLYRVQQNINTWKNAQNLAESVTNPKRVDLIRLYNDIVLDPQVSALMQSRKNKVLAKEWHFYSKEGEEIEELEEMAQSAWFVKTMDLALDSIFYGYSLIQFGDIYNDAFTSVELVPREYVSPERGLVLDMPNGVNGTPYGERPYSDWCLFAGEKRDFGLLNKAAPMFIYKKFVMSNWSEYAEMFGMPYRVGKTNTREPELFANMKRALHTIGSNASAVLDLDDDIKFLEVTKADAYQVYDKMVDRVNGELSKLFLGQTMTTDNGSSRSQSEVHENVANEYGKRDEWFMRSFINDKFVPFLRNLGFQIPQGAVCKVEEEERFDKDLASFVVDLLGKGDVDNDYILKTFGVPFTKTEQKTVQSGGSAEKKPLGEKVNSLYSKLKGCEVCSKFVPEDEGSQLFEGLISKQDIEDILMAIYYGLITVEKPPINLYKAYGTTLSKGLDKGIEFAIEFGNPDPLMLEALADNSWHFSAAKTWQFTKEMQAELVDELGEKRTFVQFKEAVDKIVNNYNVQWLRVEYDLAVSGAQQASLWENIERNKKVLPFLKYQTVGDQRVRESHRALDNIVRRVDDKFWNKFFPPNGYRCRCTAIQLEAAKESDISSLKISEEDVPSAFRFNVGKKKRVYPSDHPYYEVSTKYRQDKNNNFNLPLRP